MADERQGVGAPSPWWGEHVHRYEVAAREVRSGATILDIACGTGYGTSRLAGASAQEPGRGTPRLVVGADFDFEAVRGSRGRWTGAGLAWARMDASRLPFRDGTFDLVTSFETIEHTTRFREMARELARVVRKEGVVLVSTPNIRVSSPDGVVRNPYHTQEFTAAEFGEVLGSAFREVRVSGQRYRRYDLLRGARGFVGKATEWLLYRRGVRKLPIAWQDRAMRLVAGVPMYPTPEDFALVNEPDRIERCATLFAVCRP